MIKSIQNDQKNSLKDQNLKKQRNRRNFLPEKKSRLRAFARTRAKNRLLYNFCISSLTLANSDAHPQCVKDQFWNNPY